MTENIKQNVAVDGAAPTGLKSLLRRYKQTRNMNSAALQRLDASETSSISNEKRHVSAKPVCACNKKPHSFCNNGRIVLP